MSIQTFDAVSLDTLGLLNYNDKLGTTSLSCSHPQTHPSDPDLMVNLEFRLVMKLVVHVHHQLVEYGVVVHLENQQQLPSI